MTALVERRRAAGLSHGALQGVSGSTARPSERGLPAGSWDSHVHVCDEENFPFHPSHPYRPKKADLHDLLAFERSMGIAHVCLIAFSVYHTDNRSLLDALSRLNGQGRGIVCIDPDTVTPSELSEMHGLGVRGIRLNLQTRGQCMTADDYRATLSRHASLIRPLGWSIQLYVAMDQIALLAPVVPSLGVPVIFDHLGSPSSSSPPRTQKGYDAFVALLQSGAAWTKLSGTYRFPGTPELDGYVREILRIAPDRVVWASDWPHSGGTGENPGGDRTKHQEYRVIDDHGWVEECKALCGGDEGLIRKIWVDNPRKLWDYDAED